MSDAIMFEGMVLRNTHDFQVCQDRGPRPCVIHNPTRHHMRLWPLILRDDRFPPLFERRCEHGTGHPDPDQFHYWKRHGLEEMAVHGCDGCCAPKERDGIQENSTLV